MEKIKCYKLIDTSKRGHIGHVIPVGRGKTSAIIMIAGGDVEDTEARLQIAINEAPEHYKTKYDFNF